MALDTFDDLASAINIGLPFGRVYPVAATDLSARGDLQHVAYLYRGIVAVVIGAGVDLTVYVPQFRVTLYEPLPGTMQTDMFDHINPERTTLNWSTVINGGFGRLECGWITELDLPQGGNLPRSAYVRPKGRIVVTEGVDVCWEGFVAQGRGMDGERGFAGYGYGVGALNDGYYVSEDTTEATAGVVLAAVIAAAAPDIRPGGALEWVDPGTAHTYDEANYRSPAGFANQVSIEGGIADTGNRRWNLAVWEDRIASFLAQDAPLQAKYLIPYDEELANQWVEDYVDMASGAGLLYGATGAQSLITGTNEGFGAEHGYTRTPLLTAGEMTDTVATVYLATWLAAHRDAQRTISVTRTIDHGLELFSGAEMPCWLVRAGEWVQIGNGGPDDPVLPIVDTTFDANNMEATYTLGAPNSELDFSQHLADLCMETSSLARFVDPLTGTRTRGPHRVPLIGQSGTVAVTVAQSGRTFYADAAATFNLPAPVLGLEFTFFQTADANMAITATGDIIIVANDTCTTVTWSSASEKKGAGATLVSTGTNWLLKNHSPESYTMTLS